MAKAVGRPLLVYEGCTIGQILRRMAYFAGEYVLDKLVAYLQRHRPAAFPKQLSIANLSEAEDRSIHRCLALGMLTLNKRSLVMLFRQHSEMLAQQAAGGQVPAEKTTNETWLEHVTFSGEGSQLQADLDPDWHLPWRKSPSWMLPAGCHSRAGLIFDTKVEPLSAHLEFPWAKASLGKLCSLTVPGAPSSNPAAGSTNPNCCCV